VTEPDPPIYLRASKPPAYQSGFGNEFASEALPGALPVGQNSPQRCAYGLYAEQWNGTGFAAPRASNRRTWVYRIRPSAVCPPFVEREAGLLRTAPLAGGWSPNPMRWSPFAIGDAPVDFVEGLATLAANGDPVMQAGIAIHLYRANRSMVDRVFFDADGELLVVPQQGRLRIVTELGVLEVGPREIALLPRGLRFRVELPEGASRGHVCENYGAPLRLPDLGLVGANGLANPRDFLAPVAAFEDRQAPVELLGKAGGKLWSGTLAHSPFDVVAWHGNLVPCQYDLTRFVTLFTVSVDHPDPSIYTALSSPSEVAGAANLDFVVIPPRWLVAEHTFRPPYFHRNVMSEFLGLISGEHDAKSARGAAAGDPAAVDPHAFVPGSASLHNSGVPHGPDAASYRRASTEALGPQKTAGSYAFMFETRYPLVPTPFALEAPERHIDYQAVWQGLDSAFTGRP
jgi:homogentisate 1,2-dioxygenase